MLCSPVKQTKIFRVQEMTNSKLLAELSDHKTIIDQTVLESGHLIETLAEVLSECFRKGHKLLLCGNGGSAADAQHVAAEFINRFSYDRNALPAIALTTDSSILTCIGNDSAFENIFSRQVEALAVEGDILIGISTSGRSKNVLKALESSRLKNIISIGFTGETGREIMGPKCDYCLVVPSINTARIQEIHEFVLHVICGMVESRLFPQPL
jgi:D-sedoheptulose 7-phosphate isomerase